MKAIISLKGSEYVVDIDGKQILLDGCSSQNIADLVPKIYGGKKVKVPVILGPQGGLSPENIKHILDAFYKAGEWPVEVTFILRPPQ